MNWYALTYRELKNGDLEISTSGRIGRKALKENFPNLDADASLYDAFEYLTANGLNWIAPESIGALTDSPILSDSPLEDSGSLGDGAKVWWFPNYAIESPLQTLVETGKVVFKRAEEATSER